MFTASEDDLNIIPVNMSRDCIAQVWYRILHIIGKSLCNVLWMTLTLLDPGASLPACGPKFGQ